MRLLFEIDAKDYKKDGVAFVRNSARCITIQDGRVAMVHSIKYDYYKFPGGGIEKDETAELALRRETREEAGLIVVPASVKEFGYVHRIQKSNQAAEDVFIQDNFYYICDVEGESIAQKLDDYEADEQFTLEWIEPETGIDVNRNHPHGRTDPVMLEREARVLALLMEEGYFSLR